MNQEQIRAKINKIDKQIIWITYLHKLELAYCAFIYRFKNQDNQKFSGFRNHYGSYAAMGMAIQNTYYMKQSIIKQCIYLTKSNNPNIIKLFRIPLTTFYFGVLFGLWHIPSIFGEIALRTYAGISSAVFTLLISQEEIFRDIPLRSIIQ